MKGKDAQTQNATTVSSTDLIYCETLLCGNKAEVKRIGYYGRHSDGFYYKCKKCAKAHDHYGWLDL